MSLQDAHVHWRGKRRKLHYLPQIDVFDLFWCDIFALCHFKDVFFPVDNFERAILLPSSDVSGMQPAVLVQSFRCLFGVVQIPLENAGALHANLSAPILGETIHFRNVNEANASAGKRRTHLK